MAEKEKTKFGKFLQKVGGVFPDILEVGLTAAAGNPIQAIKLVKDKLTGEAAKDNENSRTATELMMELEAMENEFLKEMYQEDTKRILSAHELEKVQLEQSDLFTKRARPTRQYFWLLFLLVCYPVASFVAGSVIPLPEIVLIGMFGDMGFYAYKRTEEKIKLGGSLPEIINQKLR